MTERHSHSPKDPSCLEVFARLSEYLDEELPECDCRHIEVHVADCPPCVEFLRSLRKSIGASHEYQSSEHPKPLPPELLERLKTAWNSAIARRGECH